MKILYLIDELVCFGGTEKHLLLLAEGMRDREHEVMVVCMKDGEIRQRFLDAGMIGYRCIDINRIYTPSALGKIFRLAWYVRRNQVDILQTFHTASDLVGPIVAMMSGARCIPISSRRDLGFQKEKKHVAVQRLVNRLVHSVLANSLAVKDSVMRSEGFDADRVRVIYNGIDTAGRLPSDSEPRGLAKCLGVPDGRIVIGNLGHLRPEKGHIFMLDLIGAARKLDPRIFGIIGGEDAGMKEALERRRRELNLEEHVLFCGPIQDVPEFMESLDLYLQPSSTEGFSNAILEAMLGRLPVIATRVGGNVEIIRDGENGCVIEYGEAEKGARVVVDLIGDKGKMMEIGERNHQCILNRYSLTKMLMNYESYYHECIDPNNA